MDAYTMALVIIGAGTATGWVFRLIDRIEGRRIVRLYGNVVLSACSCDNSCDYVGLFYGQRNEENVRGKWK